MSRQTTPTRLVDRRDELALLMGRVDASIRNRRTSVLVLRGEAGVGKSSLLSAFADASVERHRQAGLLHGYGQAMLNSLASDSFQAVRECLRSLANAAERSGSRDMVGRVVDSFRLHAPDWVESVPMVGGLLAAGMKTGRSVREAGRETVDMDSRLDQLIGFVDELLKRGPLLLVLDDLHWADTATVDLLVTLALRVEGPLTLVLAYRPDNLQSRDEAHPLKRALFRLRRYRDDCVEIDLPRLTGEDTEVLVRQAASSRVPSGLVAQIVQMSEGNPLFAESLVRLGSEAHAGMPRRITAVLEERLSFLDVADQRILEAAALIGYSFEVDYLAQLARMDVDDVYERLDVLFSEHALVRPADPRDELDRYTIHHPLLAEVLRERGVVNGPRWRRQHRKLLELLEAERPWDDEMQVRAVAVASEAGVKEKTCAYAIDASRRQFAIGSVSKARDLAAVAVDQGTNTVEAFVQLAECLSAEGNYVAAAQACSSAVTQLGAATDEAALAVRLLWARNLRMTNSWEECRGLLDQLVAANVGPGEILAEALMLHAEIALCGPVQDTARCIQLCGVVAEMSANPELQSRAHGHRGLAHLAAYDHAEADRWLLHAIQVAREKEHPYAEYEAIHWLSKKAMACLELDRAWRLLRALAHNSDASGVASDSPWHLRDSSRVLGLQSRIPQAATVLAQYLDSAYPSSPGRAITTLACQIGELESLFGRPAGDDLLAELLAGLTGTTTENRHAHLSDQLRLLSDRPHRWEPIPFTVNVLGGRARRSRRGRRDLPIRRPRPCSSPFPDPERWVGMRP
ncbi:ATP-binding protein [Actinocorallia sp. A-T 12471]|uniref:ATP-binding protein n=1 Tax=Actinocorallia sp. A-T 12471 TaxID=3089813 RepID=UPI0029D30EF1|nr:AAA family ATPase [Actinocorallia sp. A-T 12471]MDX6738698.1 AAA family ATPase [Actinocorallia sp. A-T 12471]